MKKNPTPRHPRNRGDAVAHRTRQLSLIHQGKKKLALDDETYRALLQRVTGKSSAGDMTSAEREAAFAELIRLGFVPVRKVNFAGRPKHTDDVPMLRKVEALLADAKRPWSYGHAMAKRMFASDRLEFLSEEQLHKVIQALEVDARRRGRSKEGGRV